MKPRIAVIGGGITGAFAAYFLARLGAEPTIIERDQIAAQASGHNAGGLNPLHGSGIPGPLQELALQSLRLHREHWERVGKLSGIDFGARLVSKLLVAFDDSEIKALASRERLHNETPGFSAQWLSGDDARRAEPRLSRDVLGGLWSEGNARVDPAAYTQAVAAAAVSLGARVVHGEARELEHRDGRVTGVALEREVLACDGVVLATGPWCAEPERWLAMRLPVEPLKGELLLATPDGGSPRAEIGWGTVGVYGAFNGSVWLGGTEERAGLDATPTPHARAQILRDVEALLPELGTIRIERQVAGLRPVTPDGRPIAGIPRQWENVCLALGSGRKGMLFGAGLGLASAELLTRGSTRVAIASCQADRWETQR